MIPIQFFDYPMLLKDHLDKLNAFATVAHHKSINAASKKLCISQPALTRSMRLLEDILEVSLFLRGSKGVKLTPEGSKLLELAQDILAKVETFETSLTVKKGNLARAVRIGTKVALAPSLVPKVIQELTSHSIEVQITTDRSNRVLVEALISKELDLILIPYPPKQHKIQAIQFTQDRLGLFAHPDWKPSTPSNLFAVSQGIAGSEKTLDRYLKGTTEGYQLVDVDSWMVAKQFALQGNGSAILPYSVARNELRTGLLIPVDDRTLSDLLEKQEIPIYACTLSEAPLRPAVKMALNHFTQSMEAPLLEPNRPSKVT